jgi:hypothetical protein
MLGTDRLFARAGRSGPADQIKRSDRGDATRRWGVAGQAPSTPGRKQPAAKPRHWASAQAENPLSRFVPFSSLVSPQDVITRGGDYLRVWRLDGVPFECADEPVIAERHEAMCSLLRNLAGGQFAVWTHRLHQRVEDTLSTPPEAGFAQDLARAYATSLHGRRMMSNELYLTLVYRPMGSRIGRALQPNRRSPEDIARGQADALRVMAEKTSLVERVLRGFGPTLLGVETRQGRDYSEVAEFLGLLVNGVRRPVPVLAGPLYRILPTARLSFGADKLELRHGDERRYAAFVDIHEYADAVEPGMLNALLYEASEFIETQSFSILPRRDAMRALELQRDQLIASDDVVASQIAEMDVALNELGDGQFCMGEYHYSLLVFGDSVADAGRRAAQAIGAIGESSSLQMRPVDLVADAACGLRRCRATGPGGCGKRSCRRGRLRRSRRATTLRAASGTATRGARRWRCCTRPAARSSSPVGVDVSCSGSGLQLLHLLGQQPQRPVQADAAVDAGNGPGVSAPALRAARRLAALGGVLLDALQNGPQAVAEVFGPPGFDQLVGGDRCGGLIVGALTVAQGQCIGGEGLFFLGPQRQRLHAVDRCVDRAEVVQHLDGAFDHFALDVAFVGQPDVVGKVADDVTVPTGTTF